MGSFGLGLQSFSFVSIAILLLWLLCRLSRQEVKDLENGFEGEEVLRKRLKELLSDEFLAFYGFPTIREGKTEGGRYGLLPCGAVRVYLSEAKNHKGEIFYGYWRILKVKNGTT